MYFWCQSDKYSLIFSPLKIKFLRPHFQNFRKFLDIQEISQRPKINEKKLEIEFVLSCPWCVTKLVNFTSLTIHFSSQSDKYSNIYKLLKIKFFWRQIQDFQKFHENLKKSENSKMCWNCLILDSYCNTHPEYVFFSSVWQTFANFVDIRKQVQIQETSANPRNKCKIQETSAKSKKQVQIQEITAETRNNRRNKK